MGLNKDDIAVLRNLAMQKAEIASLPVQQENIRIWTDTNDLKVSSQPVDILEIPWHEMNVDDELTLLCESEFCREIENVLRREIYSFRHMPANMVILPIIECPIILDDSGFGISEDVDIVKTDENSTVVSRHFNIQISDEEDIEKIKDPVIKIDFKKTEERESLYNEIFDGILEVKKVGRKGFYFTPWDYLIRLTGITEAMTDLILRPDYINKLVDRFVDASLSRLEQFNKLGIWTSNNDNTRVGSGGYGYTSHLEPADNHPLNAPTNQLWGCGNAQIFSAVSPDMHWEFSLKHELRWLKRFGLNYYGCCEPLHHKMHILERIPNLRKISMSPWAKVDVAAEVAKGKYVLSVKPTPAVFAEHTWRPEQAREDILDILRKTRGCCVEIIMKDISTVRYQPQRLWEWSKIAKELIESYG